MSLENNSERIKKEIIPLSVVFQKYYEESVFKIIDMANYDIILGVLQLKKYNPQINQTNNIHFGV